MPGVARDGTLPCPRTGLPPRSAGPLHDHHAEKPLHPRNIQRAVVKSQAAARHFLHARRALKGFSALTHAVPPQVATSLFFCRHLRSPDFCDVHDEAMGICPIICAREKGLKLGDLADAHAEYSPSLPAGHPAVEMLLERFDELVITAEEEAMGRMQEASLPSDAEARMRETMMAWRCPEERPGGGEIFEHAKELIGKLRKAHEQLLISRLPMVNTQEAYGAMMAEVEREFVGARTMLRGQLRAGRNQHRAKEELELQTMYGWPPTGPGPALKRACRQHVRELGTEHPSVEDFVISAKRHIKGKEKKCIEEMEPFEKEFLRLHALIHTDPPPAKLMKESYEEELAEQGKEALKRLEFWRNEIGADSAVYLRFMKAILGPEHFLDHTEALVDEVVMELRALGPRAPASLEEAHVTEARTIAATSLACMLASLEADGRHEKAAPLRAEFASELKRVEEAVSMFDDADEEPEDEFEGFHDPPGCKPIEQREIVLEPPKPPAVKKGGVQLERALPGSNPPVGFDMRLHGVCFEDVRRASNELLLLEQCGDIIAEECGIPRDWLLNFSFTDPLAHEAEASSKGPPHGAASKGLVTESASEPQEPAAYKPRGLDLVFAD